MCVKGGWGRGISQSSDSQGTAGHRSWGPNTQQGASAPWPDPSLRDAPTLSSSPSQMVSSLSSCTSKGILEETDANNLNINPTISRIWHRAAVPVGRERASLICLGIEEAPQDLLWEGIPPLSADEGWARGLLKHLRQTWWGFKIAQKSAGSGKGWQWGKKTKQIK